MNRPFARLASVALALGIPACGVTKSENPLSPSVAGPIPGVDITAPTVLSPETGSQIPEANQPITLTVKNASTSGVRPLYYTFEVARDAQFTDQIFSATKVQPGGDGQTAVTLSSALNTGQTYYWRVQALDGANTGPYTESVSFKVYTPVVINTPAAVSPVGGATVTANPPTLVVNNATHTGPAGALTYTFQVSANPAFSSGVVQGTKAEGSSRTEYTPPALLDQTTYYWRARAADPSHTGPWSDLQSFVTPAAAPPPPAPGGGYPPAPGDALNLNTVTVVLGASNIAGWSATSTMTNVTVTASQICTSHTMAGRWPTVAFFGDPRTLIEGNQWYLANIAGRWYAGAGEWLRPGQTCKAVDAYNLGPDEFYNTSQEPLHSWRPRSGETVGIMVSTPARAWPNMGTVDQRSNVVFVKWP